MSMRCAVVMYVYENRDESDDIRPTVHSFSTDLGIQLLILYHASSRPSELSASLVIPADKLARQRLWPVERKSSYDVPGVLRLLE
jgi:hypothetical protein